MKPVILYLDDEPQNLVVFESACPSEWSVHVFDSAAKALENLDKVNPSIIVTDQRMPNMNGVQFLEIARKILPDAIRIIVTGYSDEDLIVESVRKAQIFDYIRKPWDVDDLVASLQRAFDYYKASSDGRRLQEELKKREIELRETNVSLLGALRDLELAKSKESAIRAELECWVPPFIMWALQNGVVETTVKRDIVGIAFDIINSSRLHDQVHNGRPIRGQIIQLFSETVLRHGGWRESHSGDSAYGHFGLLGDKEGIPESALAAAQEFRAGLKSLSDLSGASIECGISLHIAKECPVHIHTVRLNTPHGPVTQKSFDTSSTDVDLLHRIEKLVHMLPGSNIVMSKAFVEVLKSPPAAIVNIGDHAFVGQAQPVELHLIPSYFVKSADLERVRDVSLREKADSDRKAA